MGERTGDVNQTNPICLRNCEDHKIAGCGRDFGQREQTQLLSSAGFEPGEIAEFLGTTSDAVRAALSGLRKEKRF
jgi:hypothetical protein